MRTNLTNIAVMILALAFIMHVFSHNAHGIHKHPDNIKILYSGDYQIDVDEDSIYVSDKGRKIGAVRLDSTTAIGKLIISDNQ